MTSTSPLRLITTSTEPRRRRVREVEQPVINITLQADERRVFNVVEVLAELGAPWPDVCLATEEWVNAESSRIVRLASALSGRDEPDLIAGFPTCENGPWSMSSAEVSALVGK
ncbi:MAG: hypothetical protein KQH57_08160 [Actinomycetales bacterium]|nr:hypothetical protein [Actinomycetales bacterium]